MNILYIWDADYPWDIRVEKICQSLKNNGHCVHIASRNLKKNIELEEINGLHVNRLKFWNNNKVNYILTFPLFFSPIWRRFIHNLIEKNDINLIIVRDLPMAIAGIWAGKKHSIPVIFDMAEDYLAMLRDIWRFKKFQGLNILLRNPYLAIYVQRYVFRNSNHVLVVIDEAINVVVQGGGKVENTTIVSNTPNHNNFLTNSKIVKAKEIDEIRNSYSIIYTGGVQMGRGIQTVLKAIPKIKEIIPDFSFVIVGSGYARSLLEDLAKQEGVESYIKWIGWVDHAELFDYIRACKAGIIPHLVTDHVNTTIPNKIFDYMGCETPVICSDAIPLKRIVDEENCGLTYKGGDPDSLANIILELYKSDNNFGKNGLEAVKAKYNWEVDVRRLLSVINKYEAN